MSTPASTAASAAAVRNPARFARMDAQLPENWREILAEREGFEPSKGF
jgi:hypothetical protein